MFFANAGGGVGDVETSERSDPFLVFVVCFDPKPDEIPIFFTYQRPVASTDPY